MTLSDLSRCTLFTFGLFAIACEGEKPPASSGQASEPAKDSEAATAAAPQTQIWSELSLHRAVREKNPGYTGQGTFQLTPEGQPEVVALGNCNVNDISMLAGMPLRMLDLMKCPVTDISVLKGMPLAELYLEDSGIEDLSPLIGNSTLKKLYLTSTNVKSLKPLKGLPIEELNLIGCRADDLTPLAGMPLRMLWLTGLPVSDVSPLVSTPLVSLTLHRTRVENLQPLATLRTLQRLHIGETPVKDLTPVASLPLTRLVFTPATIEKGIDSIRRIPSLQQVGVEFEEDMGTLMAPGDFWSRFDKGEFSGKKPSENQKDGK
jgi:internalin A